MLAHFPQFNVANENPINNLKNSSAAFWSLVEDMMQ